LPDSTDGFAPLPRFLRRKLAGIYSWLVNRSGHQSLGINRNVIADLDMTDDTDMACNKAILTYPRASRDCGTRGNRRVGADYDVVSNLNEIVESDIVADNGIVNRAAVYRCISANLDIIADSHTADLRYFYPSVSRPCDSEAVRAHYRALVQHATLANHNTLGNTRPRLELRIRTNHGATLDYAAGTYYDPGIKPCPVGYVRQSSDRDTVGNYRSASDHRRMMNAWRSTSGRMQQRRNAGINDIGIVGYQCRGRARISIGRAEYDCRGPGRPEITQVSAIAEKRYGRGTGCGQRRYMIYLARRVSAQLAPIANRELRQADGHRHTARSVAAGKS
jgi:hypothetical protein